MEDMRAALEQDNDQWVDMEEPNLTVTEISSLYPVFWSFLKELWL